MKKDQRSSFGSENGSVRAHGKVRDGRMQREEEEGSGRLRVLSTR